jgi:hypothetical protein
MPTRKQRRRTQKERRHEYETVWVDSEGNELDDPPEELAAAPDKSNGAKPKAKPEAKQRGGRPVRVPPAPSWRRAAKRSLILGAVIFVFFYLAGSKNHSHNLGSALLISLLYTGLFIPFSFMIDRFAHNRWQRRAGQQGQRQQPRKR